MYNDTKKHNKDENQTKSIQHHWKLLKVALTHYSENRELIMYPAPAMWTIFQG